MSIISTISVRILPGKNPGEQYLAPGCETLSFTGSGAILTGSIDDWIEDDDDLG